MPKLKSNDVADSSKDLGPPAHPVTQSSQESGFEEPKKDDLGPEAHPTTESLSQERVADVDRASDASDLAPKPRRSGRSSSARAKSSPFGKKAKASSSKGKAVAFSDAVELESGEQENMIEQEEQEAASRLANNPHQKLLDIIEQLILTFSRFGGIASQLAKKEKDKALYEALALDYQTALNTLTVFRLAGSESAVSGLPGSGKKDKAVQEEAK
jgi:hypothetical protein